jgi:hypothetical protein
MALLPLQGNEKAGHDRCQVMPRVWVMGWSGRELRGDASRVLLGHVQRVLDVLGGECAALGANLVGLGFERALQVSRKPQSRSRRRGRRP